MQLNFFLKLPRIPLLVFSEIAKVLHRYIFLYKKKLSFEFSFLMLIWKVVCIGQNLEKPTRRVLDNFQTTFLHSKFTSIFFPSSSSDELFFPFVHAHHFINCSYRGGEITEMMRIIKEEKEVVGKKIIVMATKRADCEEAYKELSRKMSVGYVKLGLVKQEISSLLEKFRESDMNVCFLFLLNFNTFYYYYYYGLFILYFRYW